MMTQEEYKLQEYMKNWNMFFIALFAAVAASGFVYLKRRSLLPQSISLFDFFILAFATMRLTRLFVYDNITLFMRELTLDANRVKYVETGEEFVERVSSKDPLKRLLEKLSACPWCMGVWLGALSIFVYFAFPETWIFFLILAVSGVGGLFQMLANMLGWMAEEKKFSAAQKRESFPPTEK